MKPSRYNAFTPGLCCITGEIRERSYLGQALSPAKTGRPEQSVEERTEKTLAFIHPTAHIVIGTKADSDKRASFSKARI